MNTVKIPIVANIYYEKISMQYNILVNNFINLFDNENFVTLEQHLTWL